MCVCVSAVPGGLGALNIYEKHLCVLVCVSAHSQCDIMIRNVYVFIFRRYGDLIDQTICCCCVCRYFRFHLYKNAQTKPKNRLTHGHTIHINKLDAQNCTHAHRQKQKKKQKSNHRPVKPTNQRARTRLLYN